MAIKIYTLDIKANIFCHNAFLLVFFNKGATFNDTWTLLRIYEYVFLLLKVNEGNMDAIMKIPIKVPC